MTAALAAADLLPTPEPAPLRPLIPGQRLVRAKTAPDLTQPQPQNDPAWAQADLITPLFNAGQPEPATRATELRLLLVGDTLYINALCRALGPATPAPGTDLNNLWQGDALEIFLRCNPATPCPYVQFILAADARHTATRYIRNPRHGSDVSAAEPLAADAIRCLTGTLADNQGWWLTAAIPLKIFAISAPPVNATPASPPAAPTFCGNFVRDMPGPRNDGFSWADLHHGSAQEPDFFAPLPIVDAPGAPLPPRAHIALPTALAIGANQFKIDPLPAGYTLKSDTAACELKPTGAATVVVLHPGSVTLTLADAAGATVQSCTADARRALLIHAIAPFAADLTQPIELDVQLTAALPDNTPVPVHLQALQHGVEIGALTVNLRSGLKQVDLPIHDAQPGEIELRAAAALPTSATTPPTPLALEATHWCVRGHSADDFNHFRDDLTDPAKFISVDAPSLYRAALVDAWNYYRLLQAGDGRYRSLNGRGQTTFTEWSYGSCYNAALLYTVDWPENPFKGDKRFLESAAMGLDAALDAEATYPAGGHSRHIRPLVLAYELIQTDVPATRRDYWKAQLLALCDEAENERLEPATRRYTLYSEDVGTGTNHFAYYLAGVWQAGRVFNRPDYTRFASVLMQRLCEHGRDGQFPERPGVSATHYTWLTMNALGEMYEDTKDPTALAVLKKSIAYAVATSLPDTNPLLLHDGRNNDYGTFDAGDFVLTLMPMGQGLARQRALRHLGPGHKPGDSSPEYWWRTAENAVYSQPTQGMDISGPAAAGAYLAANMTPLEFTFLDGRALVARNNGFIYGLSAIHLPPTDRTFWVDPQNAVELHHATAGPILCGANSAGQPEAGSFMRTLSDPNHTVIFTPQDGTLVRTDRGHAAALDFGTFQTKVTVEFQSPKDATVRIDLVQVQGAEPVTYNFFPGVKKSADCTLSEDGKTITFGKITITCSSPVALDKDFKIINPYNQKRTTNTKPVRAHLDLNPLKTFEMKIHIQTP